MTTKARKRTAKRMAYYLGTERYHIRYCEDVVIRESKYWRITADVVSDKTGEFAFTAAYGPLRTDQQTAQSDIEAVKAEVARIIAIADRLTANA